MVVAARVKETIRVPVPLEQIVRILRDPATLTTVVARADADAHMSRVLAAPDAVTIMFGDLEDFTPLTERLGDHAAAELLSALDGIVDANVVAYGGHVIKSAGDGFMAVFAKPADALRSARCIQRSLTASTSAEAIAEAEGARGAARMRIGVHTGPVVRVRSTNGAHDLFGRNVILASRIADAASGGEVLVSSAVRCLIEPLAEFTFLANRRLSLKGFADRYPVAELEWRVS
jgi:class 3 adenylate cyclase